MQAVETEVEVSFSPLVHRYTLEEFWRLPDPSDRSHYELIGGYLFMVPPADAPHDDLDERLNKSLLRFLIGQNIQGKVFHPRASIYRDVEAGTYLEPDMMYVSAELGERMGQQRISADIVFEYVSKSNAVYDRTTKADTYLALGVRELWLVDPVTVTIEVRHSIMKNDRPAWEIRTYAASESAESKVLQGWNVSVDELFAGLV
jgi:Uma2 family endonuclease